MKTQNLAIALALLAVTAGAAFLTGRALATGAPTLTPLTYAGTITDAAGKPYPAAQDVTLKFFDKLDASVAKCTAPLTQAEAGTGRFSVVLPVECVQAVHDAPDLWTEATVGAGKTVLPRTHVGAVPFALEADSAKSAGTAVGAGGALKVQIDGLVGDLAGLKAGSGGGGGGPWVVDAAGVKLGKLLDLEFNNAFSQYRVVTSTGYTVKVKTNGTYADEIFMKWTQTGCFGTPLLTLTSVPNSLAFYNFATKAFYVANANKAGVTMASSMSYTGTSSCGNDGPQNGKVVALQAIALTALGLPANITPPLTIEP